MNLLFWNVYHLQKWRCLIHKTLHWNINRQTVYISLFSIRNLKKDSWWIFGIRMKNVHLSLGWWVSSVAWRFCKITTTTLLLVWINKPIICDKFPPASKNSSDSYRKYLVVIILCLSWNDGSVVCHGMWTFIIQCGKRFMAFDLAAEFRKYLYFCFPWYEIWSMTINFLI